MNTAAALLLTISVTITVTTYRPMNGAVRSHGPWTVLDDGAG
jgi:hypothetical protein